jgi:hypothetical protein
MCQCMPVETSWNKTVRSFALCCLQMQCEAKKSKTEDDAVEVEEKPPRPLANVMVDDDWAS